MYTFSLCNDKYLIRDTILAPHNIPFQFDDEHDPGEYEPIFDPKLLYIKVEKNHIYQGLFLLIYKSPIVAEAHLAFLPHAYGHVAEMGKECLKWIWNNTFIEHIICPILEYNGLARNCVKKMGFEEFTTENNAWVRDGTSHNYIWAKIKKYHNINED